MGFGILILIASAIWAVVLATRTADIFGQKILVLGDNMLSSNTYALSSGQYMFFWAIAIGGILLGIIILVNNKTEASEPTTVKEEKGEILDNKQCPMCAETIKSAAVVCKHCGHKFDTHDIEIAKNQRIKRPSAKYCPKCNLNYTINDNVCSVCRQELIRSGAHNDIKNENTLPITIQKNVVYSQEKTELSLIECPRCHAKLGSSQKVCNKCGLLIEDDIEKQSKAIAEINKINANKIRYVIVCLVFLIVAIIGGTYLYKTKAVSNKLSNLKGNGDASAPTGNQPANVPGATKKLSKAEARNNAIAQRIAKLSKQIVGIWQYRLPQGQINKMDISADGTARIHQYNFGSNQMEDIVRKWAIKNPYGTLGQESLQFDDSYYSSVKFSGATMTITSQPATATIIERWTRSR